MTWLRYISHPEVVVDPAVPVPQWSLSEVGRQRALALARVPWMARLTRIVSSPEPKASETAAILAEVAGVEIEIRGQTAEIDRSSTGYLPHDEHEDQADRLFAAPEESTRGWERAVDAQRRMIESLADLLDSTDDVAVVGHGGVGTLWWCHLAARPIARGADQDRPGNVYDVDLGTGRPTGPWRPFEEA